MGRRLRHEGHMPSLDGATAWLNSSPLTTEGLRGRVVVVDFWTYTCINWLRTLPFVRAWANEYEADGLVVIGVHTPEFGIEHDVESVRRAAQEMNIEYPIAIDNDYAVWEAFANHYWPALYFVDARGEIRHHHFGEGEYEQSELVIQELLEDAGARGARHHRATADPHGIEIEAAWDDLASPETYVGYGRSEQFASPGGVSYDERHEYAVPAKLQRNQWALRGRLDDRPRAGRVTRAERGDRVPLPRSGRAPDPGDCCGQRAGSVPRATRRPAAGRSARPRCGRGRRGHDRRAPPLPADPPTRTGHRPGLRDRVPRPGCSSVLLHVRLTCRLRIRWADALDRLHCVRH